jgi:RNA-directed DNA polymerase
MQEVIMEAAPLSAVPPVPEMAKPGTDTQGPTNWDWVEASVWTDRMLAALVNGVQGGKWYSLMDKVVTPSTLEAAWRRVAANKGAAGVDGVSILRFKARAEHYLVELERDLRQGSYQPLPARRVHIPKGKGKTRPLGISAVKDRIVQTAVKMVLEPIFEREFLPFNYGFRPGRGCKDALREVDTWLKAGYTWVVDADLESYFDTIPKGPLLEQVSEKISDGTLLDLIQRFLDQDILEDMRQWTPTAGVPQGSVLSPLLSNLYLHPFDDIVSQAGYKMVRYCDDFVILCRTQAEAEAALALAQAWTQQHGLRLHPEKTRIVESSQADHGSGFDFLGYRFAGGRRYVKPKSLKALRDKIRQKTGRTRSGTLDQIIAELKPTLRGWFGYFKHAISGTFRTIDGFVRRRLRAILRKREKRPGHGRTHQDHQRWPNAFFAAHGLFTLHEARMQASQSR